MSPLGLRSKVVDAPVECRVGRELVGAPRVDPGFTACLTGFLACRDEPFEVFLAPLGLASRGTPDPGFSVFGVAES